MLIYEFFFATGNRQMFAKLPSLPDSGNIYWGGGE